MRRHRARGAPQNEIKPGNRPRYITNLLQEKGTSLQCYKSGDQAGVTSNKNEPRERDNLLPKRCHKMNSDSSSSRSSSPDMDGMYLRDHLHQPQDGRLNSVSSTQNELLQKITAEHVSKMPSGSKYKLKKQVTETEVQQLRLKINGRERKRMHDLNLAMDGLREVMPYAHGPSVRKLSKIATLLLARNYILMLTSSLDEMKRLVGEIYGGHHSAFHCGTVSHTGAHSASAAHQVHPLLGSALSSSTTSTLPTTLPGLTSIRGPHSLMKSTHTPPLQLGGGFQHWAGLPCPCTICQVPPPPHIPITSTGLTRLSAENKELMK